MLKDDPGPEIVIKKHVILTNYIFIRKEGLKLDL